MIRESIARLAILRAEKSRTETELVRAEEEVECQIAKLKEELTDLAPSHSVLRFFLESSEMVDRLVENGEAETLILFKPDGGPWPLYVSGYFPNVHTAKALLDQLKQTWAGIVVLTIEENRNYKDDQLVTLKFTLQHTPTPTVSS